MLFKQDWRYEDLDAGRTNPRWAAMCAINMGSRCARLHPKIAHLGHAFAPEGAVWPAKHKLTSYTQNNRQNAHTKTCKRYKMCQPLSQSCKNHSKYISEFARTFKAGTLFPMYFILTWLNSLTHTQTKTRLMGVKFLSNIVLETHRRPVNRNRKWSTSFPVFEEHVTHDPC